MNNEENTMSKKHYIIPQVCPYEVHPAQMQALSIIQGATADQNSDVLVKGNDWDIFGEDNSNESTDATPFD